ncbi:MAG: DNA polymerase III subunit beta [Candidatus Liptonbacteria bacterium]|nr:DNA polymerase III subunit beta [Candidatus Liptonbacteria bacterium]
MKILILRSHLKSALDAVSRIVGENLNLPILKNILIKTDTNKIKISSTNLEIAINKKIPGKIIEEGEISILFSVFHEIVNNLQSERIDLEDKKRNLFFKTDNYEALIQGDNPQDFPIIPNIKKEKEFIEIQGIILKDGINKVINASQFSDLRPELSGVLLTVGPNNIKLTTTDSFRLAEKTFSNQQFKENFNIKPKIIIPLKTIQEVARNLEEESNIKIFIDENQILFKTEDLEIISRLIDGQFPDYEPIIPKELSTEILINRNELISAVKLTSSFSSRNNEVVVKIKEDKKVLEIYSAESNLGENKYLIPAKIKGESVTASFNWKYLMDGLKNINSENILFGLQGDTKPSILKSLSDVSYFYVLMPIRTS